MISVAKLLTHAIQISSQGTLVYVLKIWCALLLQCDIKIVVHIPVKINETKPSIHMLNNLLLFVTCCFAKATKKKKNIFLTERQKTKFTKLRVDLDHDLTIKLIIKNHHDMFTFHNVNIWLDWFYGEFSVSLCKFKVRNIF